MRVWLIRHCESEGNLERRFISGEDQHPLTDRGRDQAAHLAGVLEETFYLPGEIFTSPALRARQTAEILTAQASHKELVELWELREVDVGELDGLSEDDEDVMARFHEIVTAMGEGDVGARFPGGESLGDLLARADSVAQRLEADPEAPGIVVSHCLFLTVLIPALMGQRHMSYQEHYVTKGGLTILDGEPGRMSLLRLNDVSYMPPDLHSEGGPYTPPAREEG